MTDKILLEQAQDTYRSFMRVSNCLTSEMDKYVNNEKLWDELGPMRDTVSKKLEAVEKERQDLMKKLNIDKDELRADQIDFNRQLRHILWPKRS